MSPADVDLPLRPSGPVVRQSIGAFARTVGLSASALRQYGESGLLIPADVEPRTGYRYYSPEQQQRAIWIRRLRDAGLSLSRIRDILDGDPGQAERMLDDWLSDAAERRDTAASLVADLKAGLRRQRERNPRLRTHAVVDGPALAAAMRQVSAASPAETGRAGVGPNGVLLQLGPRGVSVMATDRYLLMARVLATSRMEGAPARVSLGVEPTAEWLRARRTVELVVEVPVGRDAGSGTRASFRAGDDDVHPVRCEADRFPDVPDPTTEDDGCCTRATFLRAEVRRLGAEGDVELQARDGSAVLSSPSATITGTSAGAAARCVLSSAMVARVAATAVGSDISCDIGGSGRPIVWRAPSQPDFLAMMMPRAT